MALRFWWSKSSRSVRRGLVGILVALTLSLVVICVLYLLFWWLSPAGAADITVERVSAFLDSLLAGIVAFALVGAFAFVASLRKPEDDKIDDRIAYLYSARMDENPATKSYLTEQLMLLGSAIKEGETTYRFLDVDGDAARVNVLVSMTIVNMMKRDLYKQKMPIRVAFDPVDGHTENMGTMLRIETTPRDEEGICQNTVNHLGQLTHMCKKEMKFLYEDNVQLEIPPNGELEYQYEYEGWVRTDDKFWTGVNRFAESLSVKVVNMTGRQLKISPNPTPSRPKYLNIEEGFDLKPGDGTLIYVAKKVTPDLAVTFSASFLDVESSTHKGGTDMYRDNDTQGG